MVLLPYGEKKFDDTFSRLDRIQTDGRTSCDDIVCAMHTRRTVKKTEHSVQNARQLVRRHFKVALSVDLYKMSCIR